MATFTSKNYPALRVVHGQGDDLVSAKFAGGSYEAPDAKSASAVRAFAKAHPEYGIEEAKAEESAEESGSTASPEDLAEASTGNTVAEAKAQHPDLDLSAPAASQETPDGADQNVLAQTPEEVEAQAVNAAGEEDDEDYESYTVPQLQQRLRDEGKSTGGNKADLIARLRGEVD